VVKGEMSCLQSFQRSFTGRIIMNFVHVRIPQHISIRANKMLQTAIITGCRVSGFSERDLTPGGGVPAGIVIRTECGNFTISASFS